MTIKLSPERIKEIDEFDRIRRKGGGLAVALAWREAEKTRKAEFAESEKKRKAELAENISPLVAVLAEIARRKEIVSNLKNIARQLIDPQAKDAIKRIIDSNDLDEMRRITKLLTADRIIEAKKWQGMTEDDIRKKAKLHHIVFHESELALRRRFRGQAKKAVSYINLSLKLVGGKSGNSHCTPFEKEMRDDQKARWKEFGMRQEMHKDGQSFRLIEMMKGEGKRKAAEIYAMVKGLEAYAKEDGKTWAFLTLTAPARMHSNPKKGKNSWDGTPPDVACDHLLKNWQEVEASCRTTLKIVMSGVHVTEAHEDACPHLHGMVFANPEDMGKIEAEFRKKPDWKSEAGMKFVLNNGKASAASYLFEYILKSIGSIEKLKGENGSNDAWRSTWDIRSHAFFGMPPKGLWRDLRALKICPIEPLLAGLWRAAHNGDAKTFIGLAGGLNVLTKDRPVISRKKSDSYADDKQLNFVINETKTLHTYTIKKWQRRSVEKVAKPNKDKTLGLIPNYPSKSITTPKAEIQITQIQPIDSGLMQLCAEIITQPPRFRTDPHHLLH